MLFRSRTRKEKVLPVLKKGGDVSAFRKELDRAARERAEILALVSTRFLEIRDLDETVEKEEVVSALRLALGRPALYGSCRLFIHFGEMKTAVRPPDPGARHLAEQKLSKSKIVE